MTYLQKLGLVVLYSELLTLAVIHGFISEKVAGYIVIVVVFVAAFTLSRDIDELEL